MRWAYSLQWNDPGLGDQTITTDSKIEYFHEPDEEAAEVRVAEIARSRGADDWTLDPVPED